MLKVCKFGGTSLSCSENVKKVKDIILSDRDRKIIVVSAPGKRFSGDEKVTDLLFRITKKPDDVLTKNAVIKRYDEILSGLNVQLDLKKEFDFSGMTEAEIVSSGERVMAKIMAKLLNYTFIDAFDLFFCNIFGNIDYRKSKTVAKNVDLNKGIAVPGFYVRQNGKVKLMKRGGSDLSGAYAARIFSADIYENFSDIDGIKAVNPLICPDALSIKVMSYSDFKRLFALGATVLEKSTHKPVIGTKTTILVKNTFNKKFNGTEIRGDYKTDKQVLISIANIKSRIVLSGRNFNKQCGVIKSVKAVLGKNKIKYRMIFLNKNLLFLRVFYTEPKSVVGLLYNELFSFID